MNYIRLIVDNKYCYTSQSIQTYILFKFTLPQLKNNTRMTDNGNKCNFNKFSSLTRKKKQQKRCRKKNKLNMYFGRHNTCLYAMDLFSLYIFIQFILTYTYFCANYVCVIPCNLKTHRQLYFLSSVDILGYQNFLLKDCDIQIDLKYCFWSILLNYFFYFTTLHNS